MRLVIQSDYEQMSHWAADYVVRRIVAAAPTQEKPFVLGLPTGSTPLGMYRRLVEAVREEKVSFQNVITFNMDEYVGLERSHEQSYSHFMWSNFFSHIDIAPENVHILDGTAVDREAECTAFEEAISAAGGIDLFLGGVGSDGHIAFNEPGSSLSSRTREVFLTQETIRDNSRFFGGDLAAVPTAALSVGIGTIMDAKEVLILINGTNKAVALQQAVEGAVSHYCPITALQQHRSCIIVCDEAACGELRVKTYNFFKESEERLNH